MHVIPGVVSMFNHEVVHDSNKVFFEMIPKDPEDPDMIVWYDGPQLYFCRARLDGMKEVFITVHIDHNQERDVYLHVPVSPERKDDILGGKVSLHDAFADSRRGWALVSVHYQSRRTVVAKKKIEDIPEFWFPQGEDYLTPEEPKEE